jgi:hypothetical protein
MDDSSGINFEFRLISAFHFHLPVQVSKCFLKRLWWWFENNLFEMKRQFKWEQKWVFQNSKLAWNVFMIYFQLCLYSLGDQELLRINLESIAVSIWIKRRIKRRIIRFLWFGRTWQFVFIRNWRWCEYIHNHVEFVRDCLFVYGIDKTF